MIGTKINCQVAIGTVLSFITIMSCTHGHSLRKFSSCLPLIQFKKKFLFLDNLMLKV